MKDQREALHPAQFNHSEDFSPSSTLVIFANRLPLLRIPTPAGPLDNPESAPFVLAFQNPQSFQSALKACHLKMIEQCEDGARIGCSIAASSKCRPSWWNTVIGKGGSTSDLKNRELCEERETQICMETSRVKCGRFAIEKCLPPFRDARIAIDPRESVFKYLFRFILSSMKFDTAMSRLVGRDTVSRWISDSYEIKDTNYRGREILEDVL